ncbi:MAG: hypothetical protein OXF73_01200 [Gammaproteobacteria bacterium]|nr:hypothetical protein [Gammaproteobacteria bacterium]MCY4227177.1 hypothetical protein [Gammaproteobacteria bacterium]
MATRKRLFKGRLEGIILWPQVSAKDFFGKMTKPARLALEDILIEIQAIVAAQSDQADIG